METKIESVELKGVKIASNMSEETIAFTGLLYINGKKAAHVKNDGRGGNNSAWFNDRELEKAFNSYCESLPAVPDKELGPLTMDADFWISLEVGKIDDERFWKRKCAKNMCVKLKSHKDGEFIQYKNWAYSVDAAKEVRKTHGNELVEIINERFLGKK
tara:strand:- start:26 stop:499 length:474 start_codon:yes stop_codon:yes gene_type:complete